MFKRNKLWAGISVATLVGSASLTGCGADGEGGDGEAGTPVVVETAGATLDEPKANLAEGEGEGEGSSSADLATNDLAYLTQLGLMRGHLHVGFELYQAGQFDHAKTHMKHPESELYADLAPAFEARKTKGFGDTLQALALSVEEDKGKEVVAQAYKVLTDEIAAAESVVSGSTPAEKLKRVAALLRVAGEEYGIAVVNGKMENAHEYQDAFGFTVVAKALIDSMDSGVEGKQKARDIISALDAHWPALIPPEVLSTEAGEIYGAAAKIELLALGL